MLVTSIGVDMIPDSPGRIEQEQAVVVDSSHFDAATVDRCCKSGLDTGPVVARSINRCAGRTGSLSV
jgi:hypothetical protein